MKLLKESLALLLMLLSGFVIVAAAFHFFSPLRITTDRGATIELQPEDVIAIFPNEADNTFFVEFPDSTVAAAENFDSFRRRARFNTADYSALIKTGADKITPAEFQNAESYPCDPFVDGYNVFEIRGFVYINPTYFIVIGGKRRFADCPCDDPRVIRDRHPKCPHIHHRTKQAILKRARACGLGDWFPVEKCDPAF